MKSQSNRIGGWLSKEEGEQFQAIALAIGVDECALATILVVRELRVHSLTSRQKEFLLAKVTKGKRITARPRRSDLKEQFSAYAYSLGLSNDAAAAAIFRKEISENWLGNVIQNSGNQLDSQENT